MTRSIGQFVTRLLVAATAFSQRYNYAVLAVAMLISGLAAWFSAHHIGINTDTADMLSERLPWRIAYADLEQAFPFFSDSIVVVIDAATPDLADEAATRLSRTLRDNDADFLAVFHPTADDFLRHHQLLYADTADLEQLADQLSGAQALLGRLLADPGLAGLLRLVGEIGSADPDTVPAEADTLLRAVTRALNDLSAGDSVPLSWRTLLLGAQKTTANRVVFTVRPRLDFNSVLPARHAIAALRKSVHELGYDDNDAVRVRLTGNAALAYDELTSVIRGAERAGLLAFVMIALALLIGLRSFSLVIATLLTLTVGLILTATFAAAAIGTLNMISVAFAVLYVGLGVDFAIHLGLRYRELCATEPRELAITSAARHLGASIALCAVTTAIGFFAFLPTAYRGVAELGLISGVGMFIGLLTSFTVLPALLQALPPPRAARPAPAAATSSHRDPHHTQPIIVFTVLIALLACFALPHARFDLNPLHLNDPTAESVTTIADLASDGEQPIYDISLLVPGAAAAAAIKPRLAELPTVAAVHDIEDLVPREQADKLALIEDLQWTLGADLEAQPASEITPTALVRSLREVSAELRQGSAERAADPTRLALAAALDTLQTQVETLPAAAARERLAAVEHKLMHHFVPQIERLSDALEAGPVTLGDVPSALAERWIAADGRYRLEISPAYNLDDNRELRRFVDSVRSVAGERVTGTPVINIEASRAVTAAFNQAFLTAVGLIVLLLWLILRRPAEVAVVVAPLALAGLLTTALTVSIGIPFNFANIIALPLLMGIGVDSALHMLHRYKTSVAEPYSLLRTSTARAVLFSALTTTASFGNLAISDHAGTASMGIMLTIGLAMTLVCTLVVLPALLRRYVKVRELHHE